jgi:hypothetical protein
MFLHIKNILWKESALLHQYGQREKEGEGGEKE